MILEVLVKNIVVFENLISSHPQGPLRPLSPKGPRSYKLSVVQKVDGKEYDPYCETPAVPDRCEAIKVQDEPQKTS